MPTKPVFAERLGVPALPMEAPRERATVARNSRRALAWREQLERIAGYAMSQAKSEPERAEIEAAHRAEVKRGPDWVKIRKGSDFARPVAVKDRNQLDRLLRWFALVERETYAADRAWARHEKRTIRRTIARTVARVLLALVALAKKYAAVFPSIERLASMAQCCRSTAAAALDILETIGLVTRQRRRKVVPSAFGPRVVQDTSCYCLALPAGADVAARPKPITVVPKDQNAKVTQRSAVEGQPVQKSVAMNAPKPSPAPTAHDWRARSRALLDASVAKWRAK